MPFVALLQTDPPGDSPGPHPSDRLAIKSAGAVFHPSLTSSCARCSGMRRCHREPPSPQLGAGGVRQRSVSLSLTPSPPDKAGRGLKVPSLEGAFPVRLVPALTALPQWKRRPFFCARTFVPIASLSPPLCSPTIARALRLFGDPAWGPCGPSKELPAGPSPGQPSPPAQPAPHLPSAHPLRPLPDELKPASSLLKPAHAGSVVPRSVISLPGSQALSKR